jgi:hypothetical protein
MSTRESHSKTHVNALQGFRDEDTDDVYEEEDPYPPFPTSLPPDNHDILTRPSPRPAPVVRSVTSIKPAFVDDCSSQRHKDTGVIIVHAKPHCCGNPNLRPVVRAVLTSVRAVVAYISGKYAKRTGKGDVQTALKDIDYISRYSNIASDETRSKAIKFDITAKLADTDQANSGPSNAATFSQTDAEEALPSSQQSHTVNEEYIIIGYANSEQFRDTLTPVCATIDEDGSVVTFTYLADILKTKEIIDLKDVVYLPEFACLPTTK